MNNKFWYYLHTNGELIRKHFMCDPSGQDFVDSPFCKRHWLLYEGETEKHIKFLDEAKYLGATEGTLKKAAVDLGVDIDNT